MNEKRGGSTAKPDPDPRVGPADEKPGKAGTGDRRAWREDCALTMPYASAVLRRFLGDGPTRSGIQRSSSTDRTEPKCPGVPGATSSTCRLPGFGVPVVRSPERRASLAVAPLGLAPPLAATRHVLG